MSSRSRALGTSAETAVVRYLQDHGFVYAERRALHGQNDRGDITGIPGVVIEVKNHREIRLAEWIDETETERENANADLGILIVKRRGFASPGDWYWITTGNGGGMAALKDHTGLTNWPLNTVMQGEE